MTRLQTRPSACTKKEAAAYRDSHSATRTAGQLGVQLRQGRRIRKLIRSRRLCATGTTVTHGLQAARPKQP